MRRAAKGLYLIAGLGLLVAAQGSSAQTPTALALESRAATSLETLDYAGAAKMYRKAAALRPAGDAEAVRDFQIAGILYAKAGALAQARQALETAGARALAIGDPGAAAEAFTNAAFVAAAAGSGQAAVLAHRAGWLVDMPGVSAGNRALIRHRLGLSETSSE